jgi:hypothetical protein
MRIPPLEYRQIGIDGYPLIVYMVWLSMEVAQQDYSTI